MKVSIITVCRNCRDRIERTIQSVLGQECSEVEYIVIDGCSTDGTRDLLGRYRGRISFCLSEPDDGIYPAMNKGLRLATGEVIAFLNAGDVYAHALVVSEAVEMISTSGLDAVYGDLAYVCPENGIKVVRYWRAGEYITGSFSWGWVPPHPTFFCRRTVYEAHGSFDERYRIAGDHDLMFRFIEEHRIAVGYLPKTMVLMQTGGAANTGSGIIRGNWEVLSCLRHHGMGLAWAYFWRKPLWKLSQVLSARRADRPSLAVERGGQLVAAPMSEDLHPKEGHPRIEAIIPKEKRFSSPSCPMDVDRA